MKYTASRNNVQSDIAPMTNVLFIPSSLHGFHQDSVTSALTKSGHKMCCLHGSLDMSEQYRLCSCGHRMHINCTLEIKLRHLSFGGTFSVLTISHHQLRCQHCNATKLQKIPFKADGHMITTQLLQYTSDLLSKGTYTNKQISEITGLGQNIVKAIDKRRLLKLYTVNGAKPARPDRRARFLGIDEFKLHNGHRYATHIIDIETGHVLWIANGKKKQVVYDFIEHVGLEWMRSVEAISCDMNSDYCEAFRERCPHIAIVFDYFHIVKNFNDKVISEIRKDEQKRLLEEKNVDAARALKKSRYILMSNRSTLRRKDDEAREEKVTRKGSELFGTCDVHRKGGNEEIYDELLRENKLLFTADLVKEKLADAYRTFDKAAMSEKITDIIEVCKASDNKHLCWFGRLLSSHFEGIISHAVYKISNGKIEGINQKIKTLRRHGYGYPDDEYFFLKIFDVSRCSHP